MIYEYFLRLYTYWDYAALKMNNVSDMEVQVLNQHKNQE
jgi:hypothetical protein